MKTKSFLVLFFMVSTLSMQAASILVENQDSVDKSINAEAYTLNGVFRTGKLGYFEARRLDTGFDVNRFVVVYTSRAGQSQKLGIQFDEPISGWAKITVGANGSCVLKINNQNIPIQLAEEEQV